MALSELRESTTSVFNTVKLHESIKILFTSAIDLFRDDQSIIMRAVTIFILVREGYGHSLYRLWPLLERCFC